MEHVYLNGDILPSDEARVSPLDRGFLYGDGLFETTRVMGGVALLRDWHLARLAGSCRTLGFVYTPDMDVVTEAVRRTIEANEVQEGYLRITVTRGLDDRPLTDLEAPNPTVLVQARSMSLEPLDDHPRIYIERAPFPINEHSVLAGHKSTSYQANVLALVGGLSTGSHEVYFLNSQGQVAEGSISNLFFVKDEVLRTPAESCGLLPGIARAALLRLCPDVGIACEEGEYTEPDLLAADEVMCTNSLRGIMPVGRVDGSRGVSLTAPGPVTRRLQTAFQEFAREMSGL